MSFNIAWRGSTDLTTLRIKKHADFKAFCQSVATTNEKNVNKKLDDKTKAAYFLRGGEFTELKRNDENMLSSALIIGDVDETEVPPQLAHKLLVSNNLTHFIYTSSSHTDKAPRYRILVPYLASSREVMQRATGFLQQQLGKDIRLAEESYVWSQFWLTSIVESGSWYYQGDKLVVPPDFKYEHKAEKKKGEEGKPDEFKPFSVTENIEDYKEGHRHGPSYKMAMSLVNHGYDEDDALALLCQMYPDAKVEHHSQSISSAMQRLDREKVDVPDVFDEYKYTGKRYTRLVKPPGALGLIADFVEGMMIRPNAQMAIPVAEHLISVFGGGMFSMFGNTTTRKRIILADVGAGKKTADDAVKMVIHAFFQSVRGKIPNVELYEGNEGFSFAIAYEDLAAFRVRSFITSEAGQSRMSKAGDVATLRAFELDMLSAKATTPISPPKQYRQDKDRLSFLYGVSSVYLHESTPEVYAQMLNDSAAFTSGELSRGDLFIPDPRANTNLDRKTKLDGDPYKIFKALISRFMNIGAIKGTDAKAMASVKEVDYEEIRTNLKTLVESIDDERNEIAEGHNVIQKSVLARKFEKIICSVLVQAIADCAMGPKDGIPVATQVHLDYAIARQNHLDSVLLHHSASGILSNPMERVTSDLIKTIASGGVVAHKYKCHWDVANASYVITRGYLTRIMGRLGTFNELRDSVFRGDAGRAKQAILKEFTDSAAIQSFDASGKKFFVNPGIVTQDMTRAPGFYKAKPPGARKRWNGPNS